MSLVIDLGRSRPPIEPCKQCGSTLGTLAAGTGPHFARLDCERCGVFMRWIGQPHVGRRDDDNAISDLLDYGDEGADE